MMEIGKRKSDLIIRVYLYNMKSEFPKCKGDAARERIVFLALVSSFKCS